MKKPTRVEQERWWELVLKKNRDGLTGEEYMEYERLKERSRQWMERRYSPETEDQTLIEEVLERHEV